MLLSQPRSDDGVIGPQLTQEEYARLLGSTRQSVNIALRGFERRGWIEMHDRSVAVKEPAALARQAKIMEQAGAHCVYVVDSGGRLTMTGIRDRLRAYRDVMISSGFPGYYTDPTAAKDSTVAKIGFDLTMLPEQRDDWEFRRARGFKASTAPARYQTVRQALEAGPLFFAQLMAAVGSKDGREVAVALDALREEGALTRLKHGEWTLKRGQDKQ